MSAGDVQKARDLALGSQAKKASLTPEEDPKDTKKKIQ
jgi:hypothetical protein